MNTLEIYKRKINLIADNNPIVKGNEELQQFIADCFYRLNEHLGDLFTEDKMRDGHTKKLIFNFATMLFIRCNNEAEIKSVIDVLDKYTEGDY